MEELQREKKIVTLTEVKPTQDGYRWVAITAMLLAIGIILHTVSPNVGGVTPNWTIAMYSIVINLTNPSLPQALGIGFISGMTLVPSSKSAFPLGNLASEVCGAIVCCLLVKAMLSVIYVYFKNRHGAALKRVDVRHAAGGGGYRRIERQHYLFAVRPGTQAVFCAGGR